MPYILFRPTESLLRDADFQSVAHVPCIFNDKWDYHRAGSNWLLARARGQDIPIEDGGGQIPTEQSLITFARALVDFLSWCDWAMKRPKDLDEGAPWHPWEHVGYVNDLDQRYQKSMQSGSWSASKEPLSASTINTRMDVAARFCAWTERVGLRKTPFEVPYEYYSAKRGGLNSHSHEKVLRKKRKGKVRSAPRDLELPSEKQVEAWLHAVKIKKGPTMALMCRLACEVGLRREECVQWDLDYLPAEPSKWKEKFGHVSVTIKYGTKGPAYADMDSTIEGNAKYRRTAGNERTVAVPVSLAMDLHEYRNKVRLKLITRYINEADTAEEKQRRRSEVKTWHRLFLSEYDCRPIQAPTLYKAFKVNPPYPEWSTHFGRHYYACMFMLRSMRQDWILESRADRDGVVHAQPSSDWVLVKGQALLMMLKKRLGHLSDKTTQTYLVWLLEAFQYTRDDYIKALEGGDAKTSGGKAWQIHGD